MSRDICETLIRSSHAAVVIICHVDLENGCSCGRRSKVVLFSMSTNVFKHTHITKRQ